MSQLGEPHIDVVLRPGDALYIPRGTIVATSTLGTQPQSILRMHALQSMTHDHCVLSADMTQNEKMKYSPDNMPEPSTPA